MSDAENEFSMNWTMIDAAGVNVQVTVRRPKLEDWPTAMKEREKIMDATQKTGWSVPGSIRATVTAPSQAVAAPARAQLAPIQPNGGSTKPLDWQGESASFAATEMGCETKNGKAFWKVKGGQWTKFGIIAWPEVLADAGLAPVVAKAPYNMTGWTAHYINKPDGKPDKIIKLVPPAGDEPF